MSQADGVSVSPQALIQAIHERYGRTVAGLHQECAELSAALAAVQAERDQLRSALQGNVAQGAGLSDPLAGVPAGHGVFRQEGQPDQIIPLRHPSPDEL
jgi:hypothetical protein